MSGPATSKQGTTHTAEGDADSVRGTQEVLRNGGDLSTIADGNRAVIAVGVVVGRLLIVLKALHEREEVSRGPALHFEVV